MSKLSSHYNFQIDKKSGDYKFQTEDGILYSCTFFIDESIDMLTDGFNNVDVIHFSFFPVNNSKKSKFDKKIHITIVAILQQFFEKNPNGILMYYCLNSDSKGNSRNQLFKTWHKLYNKEPKKKLFNISVDDSIEIAFLVSENHPKILYFEAVFEKELENLKINDKPFDSYSS